MSSYVQQIEPVRDEEDRRRAAEDLAARIGAEGGMRGGTFIRRYGRLFDVAAVALLVAKVVGLLPLSWPIVVVLALALSLLPPAVHGLIVGLQLRKKYADELAATRPERARG